MRYSNHTFSEETVQLDGNTFETCQFENCVLQYSGGRPPSMSNCGLNGSSFSFTDQAADTVAFMKAMYHGGFKVVIEETFNQIKENRSS